MHDASAGPMSTDTTPVEKNDSSKSAEVVSTHVLVEEEKVAKLRELSRRTRVAQSEYLREAVDDLLGKYGKLDKENE